MLVPLRLFAVTLVVVVSLVAAGCGGDDEEEGAPAGGTAADTAAAEAASFDLKIGAVLPLTGDLASFGPSQAEAARIAVEQIEDALSSKGISDVTVELVGVEDDQGRSQPAVEAATKLVQINKGERAGRGRWRAPDDPDRAVGDDPQQGRPDLADVDRARDHRRSRTTATSGASSRRTTSRAACSSHGGRRCVREGRDDQRRRAQRRVRHRAPQLFVARCTKLGGKIGGSVSWNPEPANLDSEASSSRREPEGLGDHRLPGDVREDGARARAHGQVEPAKTLMTEAMRNADVLKKVGGPAVDGLRGTAPTSQGAPARDAFDVLFTAGEGREAVDRASRAPRFDAANLAFLAAVKAQSASPARIKAKLRAVSGPPGEKVTFRQLDQAISDLLAGKDVDYEGAWGPVDWDENGDPGSAVFEIWKYGGGKITTQKTITFRGSDQAVQGRRRLRGSRRLLPAARHGDTIAVSGTGDVGPDGAVGHPGDTYAQTRRSLERRSRRSRSWRRARGRDPDAPVPHSRGGLARSRARPSRAARRRRPANTTFYVAGFVVEEMLVEVELDARRLTDAAEVELGDLRVVGAGRGPCPRSGCGRGRARSRGRRARARGARSARPSGSRSPSRVISASFSKTASIARGREARGRLVEQEQARLGDERARERDELALAAGERAGALAAPLAQQREERRGYASSAARPLGARAATAPTSRFSATERLGKTLSSCGTKFRPSRVSSCGAAAASHVGSPS